MSEASHHDHQSQAWLWFFFVCFVIVLVGIGLLAVCTYNVNAPDAAPSGGHGGMILPMDGEYAPHARTWPTV
jgi:hypothetical protein